VNVLLTCAGRRNYLIQAFRAALAGRGLVLAADAAPHAPALAEADMPLGVPRVDAPDYIPHLLDLCRCHSVGLLVPLNDLELPVLARFREEFWAVGTHAVVSDPDVIEAGFDKWRTVEVLARWGLRAPATFLRLEEAEVALTDGAVRFPLVVKPRWGTASLSIEKVGGLRELRLASALAHQRVLGGRLATASGADPEHCVLIQECLTGDEYGLDIINDLSGEYVTTFVKRKLIMRAGETDRAEVVDDPRLVRVGSAIGRGLRHVGNADCACFMTERGPVVLEITPRVGGGYPFSHAAGVDIPAALLAWAEGQVPDPAWLSIRSGVVSAKCDRLVEVQPR